METIQYIETPVGQAVNVDAVVMHTAGWVCASGIDYDTPEDAWASFINTFKYLCTWLRGYKYWRVTPVLDSQVDFETNKTIYRVYARFILSSVKIATKTAPEEANFEYNGKLYKWNDYSA